MRTSLIVAGALLLGSCGFTDKQRDEIADIAGDSVGDAVSDDDTVRDLTARIDELEEKVATLEAGR